MCFYIDKSEKARIAKKDITCWKFINLDNSNAFSHLIGIPLFIYNKDEICEKVDIEIEKQAYYSKIERGYHSYIYKRIAKELEGRLNILPTATLKKFIIPQGTRYYKNDEEYVSETIMLVE